MQVLKADTAVKVVIGPVVAVGDGFTPITTLALSTADEAEIMKHDASAVTDISGNTFAAITSMDGYYNLTITAAQLDTEGMLTIGINDDSLCLPVRHDFMVVNANVYDALYAAAATDYLQVDTIQVGGTAQTANDNGADLNTLLTRIAQTLNLTASGNIGIDWANVENPSTTVDLSATSTNLVDTATTVTNAVSLTAAAVDAIWDEVISGHLTAGTAGLYLALTGGAIVDTTVTGTPTSTTINLTAGSTSDNFYADQLIYVLTGTGAGQVRPISSYTGSSKLVTIDEAWITTPAAADRVLILLSHVHPKSQITADIDANSTQLASLISDMTTVLSRLVGTIASGTHNPQSGDSYARLGAPAGASVSADIASVQTDTTTLLSRIVGTLASGTHNAQSGDAYARLGAPAGASVSADIAAVKVDTAAILIDTASIGVTKNATFSNFEFLMVLSSDGQTPATGLTVTGQVSIDGGAFGSVSGAIAEVGNGIYQFDAAAADTNGDVITWRFSAATALDTFATIKTRA